MKVMRHAVVVSALAMGLGVVQPWVLLAAEHGGKEHGGTAPAAVSHEGSHGTEEGRAMLSPGDVATLQEAEAALKSTRPDLAKRLHALIHKLGGEHPD